MNNPALPGIDLIDYMKHDIVSVACDTIKTLY